jgi:hypothetical protein
MDSLGRMTRRRIPDVRRSTVVIELAGDAALSRDLAAGGVFVPGCTLRIAEECELVVCGANRRVSLPARVVWVDEQRGAGLELIGFSTAMREQIAELAQVEAAAIDGRGDDPADDGADDPALIEDDLAVPIACASDDDHRTLPVITRSGVTHGASFEAEADELAVPIAYESEDEHRTVPVFTIDATIDATGDATGDGAAAMSVADFAGVAVARHRTDRDLLASDPAHAIAEADAAFFDLAYPEMVDAEPHAEPAEITDDDGAPLAATDRSDDGAPLGATDGITDDDGAPLTAGDEPGADDPGSDPGPDAHDADDREAEPRIARNVHERLRGLTLVAQLKLAAAGEQHERIVLERLYGKNVWETLLRNPRLTPPEVSRIARYGSLPRVLLEVILANNAWLQVPEVRRALLSNPRLGTDQIMKVLRLVPKHELRLAAVQTAYPYPVRNAAKQLLRGD